MQRTSRPYLYNTCLKAISALTARNYEGVISELMVNNSMGLLIVVLII